MGLQGVSRAERAGQCILLLITPKTPFKKPDDALPVPLGKLVGVGGFGVGEGGMPILEGQLVLTKRRQRKASGHIGG